MLSLRSNSHTRITYIAISKRYSNYDFLLTIPEEFRSRDLLNFLKFCPKDLLQLGKSFNFFELSLKYQIPIPLDFSIIYEDNIEKHSLYLSKGNQVKIFCVDSNIKNINSIIEILKKFPGRKYYYFYNSSKNQKKQFNNLSSSTIHNFFELLEKIKADKNKIVVDFPYLATFSFTPNSKFTDNNPYYSFVPSETNFATLNQFLNNLWDKDHENQFNINPKDDTNNALNNKGKFTRQEVLLKQIKLIDNFSKISYTNKISIPVSPIESIYNPLLLILPFHNPNIKKNIPNRNSIKLGNGKVNLKKFISLLQPEQGSNYIMNLILPDSDFDKIESIEPLMKFQKNLINRLRFLDDLSYLHASFFNSPVLRLPILGKSINKELSFFKPSSFQSHSKLKNRKKIRKTIKKLGIKITSKKIAPKIINYLKERDGQIVAISDLPVEWMDIDGIPLCFTHDVCRLPETPLGGVLNHFNVNNLTELKISKDVYQKVLVIYGSDDSEFKKWRHVVEKLKSIRKFNSAFCSSIIEVKNSIDKYKPDILIFDCHGGTDSKDSSSYLIIGNQKLTNKIIIEKNITAPIIFLSACGTAPNYGFFNSIAQGFFETGAISVTTTFLPVDINHSSFIYYRLLNNLNETIHSKVHKNWLEFISHVIRTSSVFEAFKSITTEYESNEELDLIKAQIISELLFFHKRRSVYLKMNKLISKITNKNSNSFTEQIPEYLYYSHLGRSDLIYFEYWLSEKKLANNKK